MHYTPRHLPGNMRNLWKGVGSTEKLPARISNYYSYIRRKRRTNKIAIHFQEAENHGEEDMNIQIIDRLLSIPGNQGENTTKLKKVEGSWQAHLRTVGKNGLNMADELLRNLLCKKFKQLRKVFNPYWPEIMKITGDGPRNIHSDF